MPDVWRCAQGTMGRTEEGGGTQPATLGEEDASADVGRRRGSPQVRGTLLGRQEAAGFPGRSSKLLKMAYPF